MEKKMKRKHRVMPFDIFNYAWMILFALFCVLPLIIMISASFSTDEALQQYGYGLFPKDWSVLAYKIVFDTWKPLLKAYGMSFLVTGVGTVLCVFLTAMIAFPLSRTDFSFKKPVTVLMLITMMFSPGLVPTYIMITQYLNWRNNILALIVPGIGSAFYIILLRTFFQGIPKEISESARLDGCSNFREFLTITLPLSMPAIATVAVLTALNYWNDWYSSYLYISDRNLWTVQYLMTKLANEALGWKTNMGLMNSATAASADSVVMATCIVGTLPVLGVFLFLQKYIVAGMTVGAVKG